MSAPIVE